MRYLTLLLATTALFSSAVHADAGFFRDGVLEVPAVVNLDGDKVEYYANVILELDAAQAFRLRQADPRTLATIDTRSVTVMESLPVSVTLELAGVFSDPCAALEPVFVNRTGNTFQVVVAEVPPNPAALCLAAVVPFTVSVPLDVTGLPAGSYQVVVNGEAVSFELN